ncbi:MAG: ComF family protein [Firmicutes bacterium]|nr:ComF family protein [Bacillota bacterium]
MNYLLEGLLNLIFPPREECPLCGGNSPGSAICLDCSCWLAAVQKEQYCYTCGRPIGKGSLCNDCLERQWPFTLCRAVGPYSGPLKEAVHRLKYQGKQQLATPLGRLMAQQVVNEMVYRSVDMVVPIPMAPSKLRRRAFNQAHLLAVEVAKAIDRPLNEVLQKKTDTVPQANLTRQQREKNLQQAFFLVDNVNIHQRKILLIDDVITTGSTLSAAADVLRQGGASAVLALTLAATPRTK